MGNILSQIRETEKAVKLLEQLGVETEGTAFEKAHRKHGRLAVSVHALGDSGANYLNRITHNENETSRLRMQAHINAGRGFDTSEIERTIACRDKDTARLRAMIKEVEGSRLRSAASYAAEASALRGTAHAVERKINELESKGAAVPVKLEREFAEACKAAEAAEAAHRVAVAKFQDLAHQLQLAKIETLQELAKLLLGKPLRQIARRIEEAMEARLYRAEMRPELPLPPEVVREVGKARQIIATAKITLGDTNPLPDIGPLLNILDKRLAAVLARGLENDRIVGPAALVA